MKIPNALLPHRDVQVRRYKGQGSSGPVYHPWEDIDRAKVEIKTHLVVSSTGDQVASSGRVIIPAKEGEFTDRDQVKVWTGTPREHVYPLAAVEYLDGPPLPSYWVVHTR